MRASVYEGTTHMGSVAVYDFEILVSASAPPEIAGRGNGIR